MMTPRPSSLLRASAVLLLAMPATVAGQTAVREAVREPTRDSASGVPRGMMPPAGKCRVWMSGVPAARQPAPTDCATALRQKPANARVVYGPNAPEQRQTGLDGAREGKPSLLTPIGERRPELVQQDRQSGTPPRTPPAARQPTAGQPTVRQPTAAPTTPPKVPPAPPVPSTPPKQPERP